MTIRKYALTSANDADGRDPQELDPVRLERRHHLDHAGHPDRRGLRDPVPDQGVRASANDTAYKFFKLDITQNHGEGIVQLADWYLSNGAPLPPPGETAESRLDSGPTSAYNARARTGFTGVKSFRYAGHQTAEGRGLHLEQDRRRGPHDQQGHQARRTRSSPSTSRAT